MEGFNLKAKMKIPCSNCNQRLEIPEELAGQTIECPACNASLAVPSLEPTAPPTPKIRISKSNADSAVNQARTICPDALERHPVGPVGRSIARQVVLNRVIVWKQLGCLIQHCFGFLSATTVYAAQRVGRIRCRSKLVCEGQLHHAPIAPAV